MPQDQLFFVGQKAFIEKEGKILILHDSQTGYDFPGGRVQEGEVDFHKALNREIQEETQLKIQIGEPFFTSFYQFPPTHTRSPNAKLYLVYFKCTYVSGEITLSEDHDSFEWIDKESYKKLQIGENHVNALKKYYSEG